MLLSFRSPQPNRSWVVGLVSVMDAAAIHLAVNPRSAPPEARLVLRAGFTALRDIARSLRVDFDPDPSPDTPIRLSYTEFDAAVAMITAAGFRERATADAWPHFHGWRVNYEALAYELARRSDAVPALWTGPRDFHALRSPGPPRDRRPAPGPGLTRRRPGPARGGAGARSRQPGACVAAAGQGFGQGFGQGRPPARKTPSRASPTRAGVPISSNQAGGRAAVKAAAIASNQAANDGKSGTASACSSHAPSAR
ncbi:hypothetical protein ACFQ0M_06895 [Kitasatospora aburaviensis]